MSNKRLNVEGGMTDGESYNILIFMGLKEQCKREGMLGSNRY